MINLTKLKALLYGGLAFVSAIIAFLICFFGLQLGWLYSVSWGLFFGGIGAVLTRTIFQLYMKNNTPEMWQISIYSLGVCLGWLGCILCTSYTWMFIWVAVMVGMGIMLVGYRFINDFVSRRFEKAELADTLVETRRYMYIDDDYTKGDDTARPLCSVNGQALTVAEAEAQGYSAQAQAGREYISKIVKSLHKNKEDE